MRTVIPTPSGIVTVTPAAEARRIRDAALDKLAGRGMELIERALARALAHGESGVFIAVGHNEDSVNPHVAERLAAAYVEAGWRYREEPPGSYSYGFQLELPVEALVAGTHPDRTQAGGAPVLDFWRFVHERQAVWRRRFVDERPRPWTDDPVIRDRFFTNIFRDLDPGTFEAIRIVSREDRPAWERLWNLMLYRRFNREETWEAIGYREIADRGLDDLRRDLQDLYRSLRRRQAETGEPTFTDAHQVYPMPSVPGPDLTARVLRVFLNLASPAADPNVFELARAIGAARTRREAFRSIVRARVPGVSNFLSWQLTADCTYGPAPLVAASDDWAPVTTGARFGAIMWYRWPKIGTVNYPIEGWPSLESVPPRELEVFIQRLRDEQDDRFAERDLDFAAVSGGRRLDTMAIEHALCEFSKYLAAAVGLPTRDRFAGAQTRRRGSSRAVERLAEGEADALAAIALAGDQADAAPAILAVPLAAITGDQTVVAPTDLKQEPSAGQESSGAPAVTRTARRASKVRGQGEPGLASERSSGTSAPTSAEDRFREAIRDLVKAELPPTAANIFRELGMRSVSLNNRQTAWRRDELGRLGFVNRGGRWVRT